ncbi:MAG: SRPBCC domain-containing protein [Hyphomicrobiaceae bacterium]|nr:SRPBCC domain-containing protein [Hyphomicrobiaceae bacterium]
MSDASIETSSVIVERELNHPPDKIWRALTQPHLIEEWLMKTDFKPVVGHSFSFRAEWGAVDCQIQVVEPNRTLAYTWGDHDLKTVVTWTLTPTGAGTHLRMEQTGFQPGQPRYYQGAKAGWPRFFEALEALLGRID